MKYCKDCKHIMLSLDHRGENQYQFAHCAVSIADNPSVEKWRVYVLPSEETIPENKYCDVSRVLGPCGPNADQFEPKELPPKVTPYVQDNEICTQGAQIPASGERRAV